MMGTPRVTADLDGLRKNLDKTAALCHRNGLAFAAVTKCVCADPRIVAAAEACGCDGIADSRLKNLAAIRTGKPRLLIRAAQRHEMADAVRLADMSFVSEAESVRLLGREARRQGRRHRVLLALDLGDLREGCFFRDEADIFRTAEAVLAEPGLELYGTAMNLSDFGGVLPCQENMNGLVELTERLRARYGVPVPLVSGGSTVLVKDLMEGTVPLGINHCRMGELWLAGRDPGRGCGVPGFRQDCFVLEAELIEVKDKPSKPIGPIGGDAFGHVIERPDLGPMRRGLLALGKQDTELDSLFPTDGRVRVLGGSSDHTVVDLTDAPEYRAGDVLSFRLGYGAILRAWTGQYVERRYIDGEE